MRAVVVVLLALAACGRHGPIKGITGDAAVDRGGDVDGAPSELGPDDAAPSSDADGAALEVGADGATPDAPPDGSIGDLASDASEVLVIDFPRPRASLKVISSDVAIPLTAIKVDAQYFYFVSQVDQGQGLGPVSIVRLPRTGGKAEAIVPVTSVMEFGPVDGTLFYGNTAVIRTHDLTSGFEGIFAGPPAGASVWSMRFADDGLFWETYGSDQAVLNWHLTGSTTIETLPITSGEIVAADRRQVFVMEGFTVKVWDLAARTSKVYPWGQTGTTVISGLLSVPIDHESFYLPQGGSLFKIARGGGSWLKLATFGGVLTHEPVRVGTHLLWRISSENLWRSVSTSATELDVPVEGLFDCDRLFTGAGSAFCVSQRPPANLLYEVTFSGI